MNTRRDFLKKAALLSGGLGGLGGFSGLPAGLARALSVDPEVGSTFRDAEHVVILMQENRSFDHLFSSFRGVRGLEDPRAITLADGNPVYVQTDSEGRSYVPFGLDIHGTQATWMGDLPHGREDQVAAGNRGKHDRWLKEKRSRRKGQGELPLTLGFYERRDVPFYHALADAFTICDQHFCAVQSSTTPNRIFFWSGTNRDLADPGALPRMTNGEIDHRNAATWTTFPERLEDAGISWKVYQNEIDLPTGFVGDEATWLSNFGDNPLEYFSQFGAKRQVRYVAFLKRQAERLREELQAEKEPLVPEKKEGVEKSPEAEEAARKKAEAAVAEREKKKRGLERLEEQLRQLEELEKAGVEARAKSLHERAFTTNEGDPKFRKMTSIQYQDEGEEVSVRVPEGDVFYQFRKDVNEGKLPTVSWLVAGQQFSDHPSAALYGAWYVSEVLECLTKNPEVWKKTIFLLTYDENDGYFDHVPPYVPPVTGDESTGLASQGVDTKVDFDSKGVPIGLGYRVPMILVSPWTRGGRVYSEVSDLTSTLRFLEVFLEGKGRKPVKESNISEWRRSVCGDLTAAFRTFDGRPDHPHPLTRDEEVERIHRAKKKPMPVCEPLTAAELEEIRNQPLKTKRIPAQEPGTRASAALPYDLRVDAGLERAGKRVVLEFESAKTRFGAKAVGAPFQVYATEGFRVEPKPVEVVKAAAEPVEGAPKQEPEEREVSYEKMRRWSFAVKAGDRISYGWELDAFPGQRYALEVHGPNGFFRQFFGDGTDPLLESKVEPGEKGGLKIYLTLAATAKKPERAVLEDISYGTGRVERELKPGDSVVVVLDLKASQQWHDLRLTVPGYERFARRYAGRVETGEEGVTDPLIGRRGVV